MFGLFIVVSVLIVIILLRKEYVSPKTMRLECTVMWKKYVPSEFDPIAAAMQPGGYQDDGSGIARQYYFQDAYRVGVALPGQEEEAVVLVEPAMFNAVQVGAPAVLICTRGGVSKRLFPSDLELPMPDMPEDRSTLS